MSATMIINRKGVECSTKRPVVTLDAARSPISTYVNQILSIVVFIQPRTGNEMVRYGRENNRYTHIGYAAPLQDVLEQDQLYSGGKMYDIQYVWNRDGKASPLGHMVLELQETKP